MKKLDAYSPLGYSSAGVVLDVGEKVSRLKGGDKVACAGIGYANHAEVVAVPENLCVRLSDNADLKRAAYNTMGAIALQGVRQADLHLGENCAVIGLGLLGQLTCLLLRENGIRVFGIDIDEATVEKARQHCADYAWLRSSPGLENTLEERTAGIGVDAVIITAGTGSLDPINFAGRIARKRATVVVVGDVPTGFDRNPYWYRKELQLRMSCSYGPGRYDPEYEEKGHDYPAAYVRWTEKRNMEAFQEIIHSGRIDLNYLTTHEVSLEGAPQVYDMILNRTEPFLGIIIRYDVSKPIEQKPISIRTAEHAGKIGLAFIGAGSYAQSNLLPNIPKDPDIGRIAVMTQSGTTSRRAAEKFDFQMCTDQEADIFQNDLINTVFIATRHDSHARYVMRALRTGKNIFVEKPLCLTTEELCEIETTFNNVAAHKDNAVPTLNVGFNRRFSPLALSLKKKLGDAPISMLYRINAGAVPADHWIHDPDIGGGRIVGEVCHFIDLLAFFARSLPKCIFASGTPSPKELNDTVAVNMEFGSGSVGTVMYCANGNRSVPKEYIEVNQAGQTAVIEDFKQLTIWSGRKRFRKRLLVQNKGQKEMINRFLQIVKEGGAPPIPPKDIFAVTRATLAVRESLRLRQAVDVATV
jgi:polar amino acid transport system substrate-binding protein